VWGILKEKDTKVPRDDIYKGLLPRGGIRNNLFFLGETEQKPRAGARGHMWCVRETRYLLNVLRWKLLDTRPPNGVSIGADVKGENKVEVP